MKGKEGREGQRNDRTDEWEAIARREGELELVIIFTPRRGSIVVTKVVVWAAEVMIRGLSPKKICCRTCV